MAQNFKIDPKLAELVKFGPNGDDILFTPSGKYVVFIRSGVYKQNYMFVAVGKRIEGTNCYEWIEQYEPEPGDEIPNFGPGSLN